LIVKEKGKWVFYLMI
jgi:hypothetical protein